MRKVFRTLIMIVLMLVVAGLFIFINDDVFAWETIRIRHGNHYRYYNRPARRIIVREYYRPTYTTVNYNYPSYYSTVSCSPYFEEYDEFSCSEQVNETLFVY